MDHAIGTTSKKSITLPKVMQISFYFIFYDIQNSYIYVCDPLHADFCEMYKACV